MKKLLIILIVLGGGFYYFQNKSTNVLSVSEVINDTSNSAIVIVEGVVINNFKLVVGVYELQDTSLSGGSIIVKTNNKLPEIGTKITRKLQSNDIITLNDKTFSFYSEIE